MKSDMSVKHRELLEYLNRHKQAKVTELCEQLYLSESTVRRVLSTLEKQGKIRRYHGGATLLDVDPHAHIKQRQVTHFREKDAIGAKAASLVQEGMTLLLMGGTTVHAMCPYLKGKRLTIITSSLSVVNDLALEPSMQVILLGGVLNPTEMEVRGGMTQQALGHLRADIMFTGTTGLHPSHGIMTDDPNGVETYTTCMRISDAVYVLADHSKCDRYFGTTVLCDLSDVSGLIIDERADKSALALLQEHANALHIAPMLQQKQRWL